MNGTLLFVGNDGVHGAEFWKCNGTAAGTVLVKDIALGSLGENSPFAFVGLVHLTDVDGTLYFVAQDGNGQGLWKYNASGCTEPSASPAVPSWLRVNTVIGKDFAFLVFGKAVLKIGNCQALSLVAHRSNVYVRPDGGTAQPEAWERGKALPGHPAAVGISAPGMIRG